MFESGVTEQSANPGADFYAILAPILLGAGFTYIESIVISSRTHALWRAPDTNSHGEEWVFDCTYYATGVEGGKENTFVWFHVYEDYDSGTNLATRGAMYPYSGVTLDSLGSSTAGVDTTLEDDLLINPTYEIWGVDGEFHYGFRISAEPFAYWISATHDRVVLMSSLDSRRMSYVGLWEAHPVFATAAGANLFPLCTASVSINAQSEDDYLYMTRYIFGKTLDETFAESYQEMTYTEISVPMRPGFEWAKSVGGPRLYEMVIGNFNWGWHGSLIGVRSVASILDFNIGEAGLSIGRGDILNVTDDMDPGTTTANQQWVVGFPSIYNSETGIALAMKME